jgi:hypothetical protein
MVFQKLVITKDSRRETTVTTSETIMESAIKPYGRHVVVFNVESIGCS